jgi:hypothetical protein
VVPDLPMLMADLPPELDISTSPKIKAEPRTMPLCASAFAP